MYSLEFRNLIRAKLASKVRDLVEENRVSALGPEEDFLKEGWVPADHERRAKYYDALAKKVRDSKVQVHRHIDNDSLARGHDRMAAIHRKSAEAGRKQVNE